METTDFLMYYLGKEQIKDLLREYSLKVSGNKDELIRRLIRHPDFDIDDIPFVLYKEELQEICDLLDIPRTGSKDVLWENILSTIGDLSTTNEAYILQEEEYDVIEIEDVEKSVDVSIIEIKYSEKISSSVSSFQVDLVVQNNSPTTEIVQIWHRAGWPEGGSHITPQIKLKKGEEGSENILLPTPSSDGDFTLQLRLLDSSGIQIRDQRFNLEVEVKTSGKEKILKFGKELGRIFISKL